MIRALILDFDGLIIDTETTDYQAWREVYQAHGCDLPLSLWAIAVGRGFSEEFEPFNYLESQIGRAVDRAALGEQRRRRDQELVALQPVLPGVVEMLKDARRMGLKTAVASSSSFEWVGGHLMRLGLIHYFDAIRTSDDVMHTKPAPDLFLAALEALGVEADEAVVFEDSPNGITAAKRAGIYVVAVPNDLTSQLALDHADMRLNSLEELTLEVLLARINASWNVQR